MAENTQKTDFGSTLEDFIATINENPKATDQELFEAFPEFNNDKKMLDAAFVYRNTKGAKKYDDATLKGKFPEFFSVAQEPQAQEQQPAAQPTQQQTEPVPQAEQQEKKEGFGWVMDKAKQIAPKVSRFIADPVSGTVNAGVRGAVAAGKYVSELPKESKDQLIDISKSAAKTGAKVSQFMMNPLGGVVELGVNGAKRIVDTVKDDDLKQTEQDRINAAKIPMSTEDAARESAIAELRTKGMVGADGNMPDSLPLYDINTGKFATDNKYKDQIKALEEQRSSYMQKPSSMKDAQNKWVDAYLHNTDAGKQILSQAENEFANTIDAFYADFKQSKQYADIVSQYQQLVNSKKISVNDANEQLNEELNKTFTQIYGEQLKDEQEKIFTPIYQEALKADNGWLKQQQERIDADAIKSLNSEISTIEGRMSAEEKQIVAYSRHAGLVVVDTPKQKTLNAAKDYLTDAKRMMEAAQQGKGFWSGLGESLSDMDTWDFGFGELTKNGALLRAVNKSEKGEALTEEEEVLLDAASQYMAVTAYYSDKLGRLYKVGQTTGVSIPFMLEFMVTPLSGIENGVVRGLLKWGTKRLGIKSAEKATQSVGRKVVGQFLKDALIGAPIMTAVYGSPSIAADAMGRMSGNIIGKEDASGVMRFDRAENRQGALEATWNAALTQYAENESEIIFNALAPIAQPAKKFITANNLFKKVADSNVGQVIVNMRSNPVFSDILSRAQFHGYVGEVLEEEVGNLIKWAGSTDINSAKEAGFNIDDQIDTVLGLAPTSIAFGAIGMGLGAANVARVNKRAEEVRNSLESDIEKQMFDNMMTASSYGDFKEQARGYIESVLLNKNISVEDKKVLLQDVLLKAQDVIKSESPEVAMAVADAEIDNQTNVTDNKVYHVVVDGRSATVRKGIIPTKDNGDGTVSIDTDNAPDNNTIEVVFDDDNSVAQVGLGAITLNSVSDAEDEKTAAETHAVAVKFVNDNVKVGDTLILPNVGDTQVSDVNYDDGTVYVLADDRQGGQVSMPVKAEDVLNALRPALDAEQQPVVFVNNQTQNEQELLPVNGGYKMRDKDGNWDDVVFTEDDLLKQGYTPKQEAAASEELGNGAVAPVEDNVQPQEEQVPDWTLDNAADARKRGFRMVNGNRVERTRIEQPILGKKTNVAFGNTAADKVEVEYAIVDANSLKPSVVNGQRNENFFINEAQPKDRTDQASQLAALTIASNIEPERIVNDAGTAYAGSPIINEYGEVIQGNNRSDALMEMYNGNHKESIDRYKSYLKENAASFGLTPEDIDKIEKPVLVRYSAMSDEDAIRLGQMNAQDTESGGTQRIPSQQTMVKLGDKLNRFAELLMETEYEGDTIADVIAKNGERALVYLRDGNYITPTQFETAHDRRGDITSEGKADLLGIVQGVLFANAKYDNLQTMFDTLPASAQRAILQTIYRSQKSDEAKKIVPVLQDSIAAFYTIVTNVREFRDVNPRTEKAFNKAQGMVHTWQKGTTSDFSTGKTLRNSEIFDNFAVELAAHYKADTQKKLVALFNNVYDNVLGKVDMFDTIEPMSIDEALSKTLNIQNNGKQTNTQTTGGSVLGRGEGRTSESGSNRSNQGNQQEQTGNEPATNVGGSASVQEGNGSDRGANATPTNDVNQTIADKIAAAKEKEDAALNDLKALLQQAKDNNVKIGISGIEQQREDAELTRQIVAAGARLVSAYVEQGVYRFADVCNKVFAALGDLGNIIKNNSIKKMYLNAKVDASNEVYNLMDSEDVVRGFDVENYDKQQFQPEEKNIFPYGLSNEIDDNGKQFVLSSNGSEVFGIMDEESGLVSAPILLSEGEITDKSTNNGYGLVHIEARHGDEIRKAGYKSVVDFVEDVAKNYETIKQGKTRDGNDTYLLQLKDKNNNTLIVELSTDGTYWNINTAGIFRETYGNKNKEVYNRHATNKQPTETVGASQFDEQNGSQTNSSMNAPTTSDRKDTTKNPNTQENSQKNDENILPSQENVVSLQSENTIGVLEKVDDKYIIRVPEDKRVSQEEFLKRIDRANTFGGRYRRGEGYIFTNEKDANDFNNLDSLVEMPNKPVSIKESTDRANFMLGVQKKLLQALEDGEKPFKSIVELRAFARENGLEVDKEGKDDILLQELVEDAIMRAGRKTIARMRKDGASMQSMFDQIVNLYELQPTISRRDSNRVMLQQYSTPIPMSFVADMFAYRDNMELGLEPTAGNGMLVFGVPEEKIDVNEIDANRLYVLHSGAYNQITNQDATKPFNRGQIYDFVISNPPFGALPQKEYDGKKIGGLAQQIAINALNQMKDNGRAAIIVGGNMSYRDNGSISSDVAFYSYLYDNYNVVGVVDMAGDLYSKQGTSYPTRMILINGRRSAEDKAQSVVYPPVQDKALPMVNTWQELYDTVNKLNNLNQQTNGYEVLRSENRPTMERGVAQNISGRADDIYNTSGNSNGGGRDNGDNGNSQTSRSSQSGTESQTNLFGEQGVTGDGRVGIDTGKSTIGKSSNTSGISGTARNRRTGGRLRLGVEERYRAFGSRADGLGITEPRDSSTKKKETVRYEGKRSETLPTSKAPYIRHNDSASLESVAPTPLTEAMDETMTRIAAEVGNIDEFVTDELGYESVKEMHDALLAEQVDSVAAAIYQLKQGQALVIGDQTGIGKGRQMAALIRWACRQGKKPIFLTKDATLFSDLFRDMKDIHSGGLVPFIFNAPTGKNPGRMSITDDENKEIVVYNGQTDKDMSTILSKQELPDGYDYIVASYSQFNRGFAEEGATPNKQQQKAALLRKLAKDNFLLMDESHTAASSGEVKSDGTIELKNTAKVIQTIIPEAQGVVFASATFAKRPDSMPMYALKTVLGKANVPTNTLIEIIQKGGVALQEIMSRALAQSGQMFRRERDMGEVKTDWITEDNPELAKRARDKYDQAIRLFRDIIQFQQDFIDPQIESLRNEVAAMQKDARKRRGTEKMGIDNPPFASKTYNYVKQLLLALKVPAIVERTISEVRAGRHPVIALENTMERFIDAPVGTVLRGASTTFAENLKQGLQSTLAYTVEDNDGTKIQNNFSPADLGTEGEVAYYELMRRIEEETKDIFVSPLDGIRFGLMDAGLKVNEITGRDVVLERGEEKGTFVVSPRQDRNKNTAKSRFQNGDIDVIILNKSGSTGISLHADKRKEIKDKRQRTMIIAQALSDINDYMQMIGRIDRTGQAHRGYYINLSLPIPAENRLMMMLATKLKSLNANTTASQDNASGEMSMPDMLNKYGSKAVLDFFTDNRDIFLKLLENGLDLNGIDVTTNLEEIVPMDDEIIRKVTGYVALLPIEDQEKFYADVAANYIDHINYLNEIDENDLKVTVMPLRAKTIKKQVASQGVDPNSENVFAQNSYLETVEMDVLKKPLSAIEINKYVRTLKYGGKEGASALLEKVDKEEQNKLAEMESLYNERKAKAEREKEEIARKVNSYTTKTAEEKAAEIERRQDRIDEALEAWKSDRERTIQANSSSVRYAIRKLVPGATYLMPDNLDGTLFSSSSPAIFMGFKGKDDGITKASTIAVFAVMDSRRRIEVKLNETNRGKENIIDKIVKFTEDNQEVANQTTIDNWDRQKPTEQRKTGYIMTGNIIQAFSDTADENGILNGKLISYTDIDGNTHDGILMPDNWTPMQMRGNGVPINARLTDLIENDIDLIAVDDSVKVAKIGDNYRLYVPSSKTAGGKYYTNAEILGMTTDGKFTQRADQFFADIPARRIEDLILKLANMGVRVKDKSAEMQVVSESIPTESQQLTEALIDHLEERGVNVQVHTAEEADAAQDNELQTPDGTVYGWYENGTIHLVEGRLNPNTTIHEMSHMLSAIMREQNPEGWADVVRVCKANKPLWNDVVNDPNYQGLQTDDEIASEVVARYSGKRGAEKLAEAERSALDSVDSDNLPAYARMRTLFNNIRKALTKFWNWCGKTLFNTTKFENIDEIADMTLAEVLNNGQLPTPPTDGKRENSVENRNEGEPIPYVNLAEIARKRAGLDVNPVSPEVAKAQAEYEKEITKQSENKRRFYVEWLDAAKPLENFQNYMVGLGAKLTDAMNAYKDSFLSRGDTARKNYERQCIRPLTRVMREIIDSGKLNDINLVWQNIPQQEMLDAKKDKDKVARINGERLTPRDILGVYAQAKDIVEAMELGLPDRGYAGFMNEVGITPEELIDAVESRLGASTINNLWQKIRKATSFALDYQVKHGFITPEKRAQYKRPYYVPERGWNDRDNTGVPTEYVDHGGLYNQPYNAALKQARGRTSLASDPFAYIESITYSTIATVEKNRTKQCLLNFCLANMELGEKTGAFEPKRVWSMNAVDANGNVIIGEDGQPITYNTYARPTDEQYQHDEAIKREIDAITKKITQVVREIKKWTKIASNDKLIDEVRNFAVNAIEPLIEKEKELNQQIEDLRKQLYINTSVNAADIPFRSASERGQNLVYVMKDGQQYVIQFKDEKITRAINKDYNDFANANNKADAAIRKVTRYLSGSLTQYNPEFAVTNFLRDFQVAQATILAEHPDWIKDYNKNFIGVQRAVWAYAAADRISEETKYVGDKIKITAPEFDADGNKTGEKQMTYGELLQEYFENGAQTGFSYLQDVGSLRKDFEKMLTENETWRRTKNIAFGTLSMFTEVSETAVRFAAYVTARQNGMNETGAAFLSKEISTNFDRRGENSNSPLLSYFTFMRAALNGTIKFTRVAKGFGKAYGTIAAVYLLCGVLNQLLNPNDPDDETWANEYVRDSNFIIGKTKWPVAHFFRMFFAMGNNIGSIINGTKTSEEAIYDIVEFTGSELLPSWLNFTKLFVLNKGTNEVTVNERGIFNYVESVMPSFASPIMDNLFNTDFMGMPINGEWGEYPGTQDKKNVLKYNRFTPKGYIDAVQGVYSGVGSWFGMGNLDLENKNFDNSIFSFFFDNSPSKVQHFIEGYTPAVGNLLSATAFTIQKAMDGEDVYMSDIPFVRRLYSPYKEKAVGAQQYWLLDSRQEAYKAQLENARKNDENEYQKMQNSEKYRFYEYAAEVIGNIDRNSIKQEDIKQLFELNKKWNELH